MPSIIFVHGTGVRSETYKATFAQIEEKLVDLRKTAPHMTDWNLSRCIWGDDYGVKLHLQGKSLPEYKGAAIAQKQGDLMDWWLLYQDPEMELRVWEATEKAPAPSAPGFAAKWKGYNQKFVEFTPAEPLAQRLAEAGLKEYWKIAQADLLKHGGIYERAVQTVATEQDFHIFSRLFARALVARATALAQAAGHAAPIVQLRDEIIKGILEGLVIPIAGVRSWAASTASKVSLALNTTWECVKANMGVAMAYTGVVGRDTISDLTYRAAGDILLYQTRGEKIRQCIKETIDAAEKPVVLLAHSLGGIACVDLLIKQHLPVVKGLITAGSQAPLLYEMNCLSMLEAGQPLPGYFPKWLNVHDLCDLLSYPAAGVFPQKAVDKELDSGLPYLQAHCAYWNEPDVWQAITEFILNLKV